MERPSRRNLFDDSDEEEKPPVQLKDKNGSDDEATKPKAPVAKAEETTKKAGLFDDDSNDEEYKPQEEAEEPEYKPKVESADVQQNLEKAKEAIQKTEAEKQTVDQKEEEKEELEPSRRAKRNLFDDDASEDEYIPPTKTSQAQPEAVVAEEIKPEPVVATSEKKDEGGGKRNLFDDDDEEEYAQKKTETIAPVKKSLYDDDDDDEAEYVPKPSIDEVVKNAAPVQDDDEDEQIAPIKNPSPKHKRDNLFDGNNDESDEYVPTEEVEIPQMVESLHQAPAEQAEPIVEEPKEEKPKHKSRKNKRNLFDDSDENDNFSEEEEEEIRGDQYKPTPASAPEENKRVDEEQDKAGAASDEEEYHPNYDYVPHQEFPSKQQVVVDRASTKFTGTDAEIILKQEVEKVKNEMLSDLKKQDEEEQNMHTVADIDEEIQERMEKFTVSNPKKMKSNKFLSTSTITGGGMVTTYTVKGVDDEGAFEVSRRYRVFYALFLVFKTRWPGCFLPQLPEKNFVDNDSMEFIMDRMVMLERWLKDLSKYDHYIYSAEFKIFTRSTNADVDKQLKELPQLKPMAILEKYRINFKNIDHNVTHQQVGRYKEALSVYQQFLKKAINQMEKQQKTLNHLKTTREKELKWQPKLLRNFQKFEKTSMNFFADGQAKEHFVLNHASKGDVKETIGKASNKYKNPLEEAYAWHFDELVDLKCMYEAIQGRDEVYKNQIYANYHRKDQILEMEKIKDGLMTMKTFMKSKAQKQEQIRKLQEEIDQAKAEYPDYNKLIEFVVLLHYQVEVPRFKAKKRMNYINTLNNVAVKEIKNAHVSATLFHGLMIDNSQN